MRLCISTRILMQLANATSSCKHSSGVPSDHAASATFTCSSKYLAWSFMRAIDDDFQTKSSDQSRVSAQLRP